MRILVVRHAEAIDPDLAPGDSLRWLTDRGRAKAREVVQLLRDRGIVIDRIFTSPLVRAVQTAEIFAGIASGGVVVESALAGGTTARVLSVLDEMTDRDTVAFIGHEPHLRSIAARALGVEVFPGFHTCGTCLIEVTPAGPRLGFMLDPRTLTVHTSLEAYAP